jgi:hypothetical protein
MRLFSTIFFDQKRTPHRVSCQFVQQRWNLRKSDFEWNEDDVENDEKSSKNDFEVCPNFTPYLLVLFYWFLIYVYFTTSRFYAQGEDHRHLSNIDCLTARIACLVWFISTVNGRSKKWSLGRRALVTGT